MKLQNPKSKIQKNFKGQNSDEASVRYLEIRQESEWSLNEDANLKGLTQHVFDLEERTARFGESIIRFSKKIPQNAPNNRLIDQLMGCGTSVGANYCEASEKVSKKDFKLPISRCERSQRNAIFSSNDRRRRTKFGERSPHALSRSQRTAHDLRDDLSKII